ncbi:MAG: hypothetical protein IJR68_08290 [Fretibacterium sp.]|nr:hypothetical protein [Fretibacterium sp.]
MEDLYSQIDFIVSGGALKLLTDFLGSKDLPTLVVEPSGEDFQVLDAVGLVPDSLMIKDKDLHIHSLFSTNPPLAAFEVEQAKGNEMWPCVIRMRGAHWELYLLLKKVPESSLVEELHSYAGLVRIWRTVQRIDETEKQLSRLSYMILATKSTLASIFEPMPLQYFAAFLTDVLHESLFPKTVVVFKDQGSYLTVFNGKAEDIPERKGVYAEPILPPTPVITRNEAPYEIVLPVTEGETRLFCRMTWDALPDAQMINFMELLGNLAVRAIVINNLRLQNQQAASYISRGEFTVLSLSNVLKILKGAGTKERFLSLLVDFFVEQCRLQECILAVWDRTRQGYIMVEKRSGRIKVDANPALLPAPAPVPAEQVTEISYNLEEANPDLIFKSLGLAGCPWPDVASMRYLFPICDETALEGMLILGSEAEQHITLDKSQLASLHLIAQFAAYEFKRF